MPLPHVSKVQALEHRNYKTADLGRSCNAVFLLLGYKQMVLMIPNGASSSIDANRNIYVYLSMYMYIGLYIHVQCTYINTYINPFSYQLPYQNLHSTKIWLRKKTRYLLYDVTLSSAPKSFFPTVELAKQRHTHKYHNIYVQWLFLVPIKGGRWHIIPQLAVYTTYIPLIYCLLGGYIMLPTTF